MKPVSLLLLTIVMGVISGLIPGGNVMAMISGDMAAAKDAVFIRIEPEVSIATGRIYLKDIAVIDADAFIKNRIGGLYLGPAPRLGKHRTLSGEHIASQIQSKPWPGHVFHIDIPENVIICRESQTISENKLLHLFTEYVQGAMPEADLGIRRFKVRGLRPFPPGMVRLTVVPRNDHEIIGSVNLKVDVSIAGRSEGKLYLSAWVDQFAPVVCVRRSLTRNTILHASDLVLERKNISRTPGSVVLSITAAVGKRVKRSVRKGTYLRDDILEKPPLVCKSDRVRLIAQKGALTVQTVGIAKEGGGKGEQVRVENIASGKTVVGRVVDASTVKIIF